MNEQSQAGGSSGPADAYGRLAKIALTGEPLGSVLTQVARLARDLIPGADDVSVTLIEGGKPRTVAFAGDLAVPLDERQYQDGFGPCIDAAVSGHTLTIVDTERAEVYPHFCREARRAGVHHTLSMGIAGSPDTSAGMNFYGLGPAGPFGQEAQATARAFADYAGVAIMNAATYDGALRQVSQMHEAMASRAGIEQAKGIIMAQRRCSADEAFALLVSLSSKSNRKVRDVAIAIIEQATRAT